MNLVRCNTCPYPDTCSYFDECSFVVKSHVNSGDLVWAKMGSFHVVATHEFAIQHLQEAKLSNSKRTAKPAEREAVAKRAAAMPTVDSNTPHITDFPDLVDVIPDLAAEYRDISDNLKPLEVRKKEVGDEIKALVDAADLKSVRGTGWIITRSADTFTETIKPELLLANGVTMDQIAASTVRTPRAGYVQVKKLEE